MIEDSKLIRQYAVERSEPAFAELVRRHLKMVYAAGLRQVNGDAHLAEDVAQSVFADLARQAGKLQHHGSIAGWLYTSTRFVAAKAVRMEARRRAREQAVVSMNEMNSNTNADWNELRPMIDEMLGELVEADREAIVLRYFEAQEFSLVGMALGVSENTARMRVDRALEKLRVVLQKRGVTTTGAALAGVLAESSGTAVPVQLADGITSRALTLAAATSVRTAPSILKLIAIKKLSLTAISVLSLTLAAMWVVRSVPNPNPQTRATESPKATQAVPVQHGGLEQLDIPKGDPDIFKKMMQRHNEQARAREAKALDNARAEWAKKVAAFDDSLKEEPGVKKFGAKIQSTFFPGRTLVASGWRTDRGKNRLIFVTPQRVTESGEPVGVSANPNQVMIKFRLIEVPDEVLDSLGMATFKARSDGMNPSATLSNEQADSMVNSITKSGGIDSVDTPKVSFRLGGEARIVSGSQALIAGIQQQLGLQMDIFPTLAADGNSLDIEILARDTVPAAGWDAP